MIKSLKKFIFITLGIIGFLNVTNAQQYNFENYNVDEGLAQSQIYSMIEDSRGYIWIGCDGGGISRFDGINFKNFTVKDGLCNEQVRFLFEDSNNNIWIATKDGYLGMYDGEAFVCYNKNFGLNATTILSITEDSTGNIWVGTENHGLFTFKDGRFNQIDILNSINDYTVNCLYYDKLKRLWIGTEKHGLFLKDGQDIELFTTNEGLPGNSINTISSDEKNIIWIGTKDGAASFDGKSFKKFTTRNGLPGNNVMSILQDRFGGVWFGTYGHGAAKIEEDKITVFNESNGLSNAYVSSIIQDMTGNIWFGTDGEGVFKYSGERFRHLTVEDGLGYNIIMGIEEDLNKNLWFATYGNGLSQYYNTGAVNYNIDDGLCSNVLYCVEVDGNGKVWAGSKDNGISVFDGSKLTNYSVKDGLGSNSIYEILKDSYNNIWIATRSGGISIWNGKKFTNITKENGLACNDIYTIFEDKDKNIWIGTDNHGVNMIPSDYSSNYIIENGLQKENVLTINSENGLNHNQILAITQDKNGFIWFGSFGGGICKFDGREFYTYTTREGLNSNNVYLMLFDDDNYLWLGTEKGLNKINFKTKGAIPHVVTYGKAEGFVGIETNLNSVLRDSEGNYWFGTIKGATRYNPKADLPNIRKPKIHISTVKLFYQKVNWSKYSTNLNKWTHLPKDLVLPYNENHLSFEFIGISMKNANEVQYQWMLEGFDSDWSPISKQNKIAYTNIPPGKYTFKVKAKNKDGIWNNDAATFIFEIQPPFWKTKWFYFFIVSLVIFVLISIIRIRDKKLRNIQQMLEEKIEIRTIQIKNQRDTLEQKNAEILEQQEELKAQSEDLMHSKQLLEQKKLVLENALIALEDKNRLLKVKNNQITNSIMYAQKIQKAMLPSKDLIKQLIPESFIYYRPKDFVSGDFYWIKEKNGKIIVAAVDCTGHGVPGALMSLIGHSLLEKVILEDNINSAADVLDLLKVELIFRLKSDEKEFGISDGMDMSLVIIDYSTNSIQFAGAYSPIYHISENNLIEYKGDKFPVGRYLIDAQNKFTNKEFNFNKGDYIYLFTDGYSDQLGGPDFKKFFPAKFKKMLIDIHLNNPDQQLNIISETMDSWISNNEQLDDMLILGIKL